MKIIASDYDTETGFGWIRAIDTDNEEIYFQACLVQRADGRGYKKTIAQNDSGADWGLSGDANTRAIEKHPGVIWTVFKREMRRLGIKFV